MSRALACVRVLAVLAASFTLGKLILERLGEHARWSGHSPDEQARIRADERRLRALGEPDHFDVLAEFEGALGEVPARHGPQSPPFWRHQPVPGGITHLARRGEACGSCGEVEPA